MAALNSSSSLTVGRPTRGCVFRCLITWHKFSEPILGSAFSHCILSKCYAYFQPAAVAFIPSLSHRVNILW
jgi:hypothetical protein